MIELKFPDGAVRQYPAGSTGRDVAAAISPSLAKKAALVVWNGEQRYLDRVIDGNGDFRLLMRDDPEALETIRHDKRLDRRRAAGYKIAPGAARPIKDDPCTPSSPPLRYWPF